MKAFFWVVSLSYRIGLAFHFLCKNFLQPEEQHETLLEQTAHSKTPLLHPVMVEQSISQSINTEINQSISQSVRQSINQTISQSINQSINQSISQSVSHLIILCHVVFIKMFSPPGYSGCQPSESATSYHFLNHLNYHSCRTYNTAISR